MSIPLSPILQLQQSGDVQQIINAPLKLAAAVSSTAQSLLTGLLERGCSKRLGWIHDFVSIDVPNSGKTHFEPNN